MRRLALALAALAGCSGGTSKPAGVLEIGVQTDGGFVALQPDDAGNLPSMLVSLGPNGLNMVVPSLRAAEIDPRAPDPTVTVEVGGAVMAADIEGSRVDMTPDGQGNVLWDLRVPFQTELCCFTCQTGKVRARIRDASGRVFEGETEVRLERGGCPDVRACCASRDECPVPELTTLCQ